MRLTQTDRDAFVRAVMNDVPVVDYQQQARDLVEKHFISTMPPKLRAVYNDPKLRGLIKREWTHVGTMYGSFVFADKAVPADLVAKVNALMDKDKAQTSAIEILRDKLHRTVSGVSTRKRLIEALPEFEKYAPSEFFPATPNLPALANVVSDFVKAGWPKDGKAARA